MHLHHCMRRVLLLVTAFLFSYHSFSQAPPGNEEIKKIVKESLSKLTGNEPTTIGDFTIEEKDNGEREISGPLSIFGKGEVQVAGKLRSNLKPSFFKVDFPATAVLDLNMLNTMTGGSLASFLPDGFSGESGIAIKKMEISLDTSGYTPEKINLSFAGNRPFGLLGDGNLVLDKTVFDFVLDEPKSSRRKVTGTLGGSLLFGNSSINLSTVLSTRKEDIKFTGSVNDLSLNGLLRAAGGSAVVNTLPSFFSNLSLQTLSFDILPFQKTFSVSATSSLGEVELKMSPGSKGGAMHFLLGLAPPANFSFSSIDPSLGLLDGINLGGTALVISSYNGDMESSLKSLQTRSGAIHLVNGLNLFTHIRLGSELGQFLGKPELDLSGSLDKSLNLNLDAALTFDNLKLGGGFSFKEVKFGVGFKPSAAKVNFRLSGRMEAMIKNDLLSFNAGFDFSPTDVQLSAFFLMEAIKKANAQPEFAVRNANNEVEPPEWKDPFGIKGVGLRKLGFSLGVSPKSPIFLSSLGMTASVRLGVNPDFNKNIAGSFSANLDIANPFNSMLDIKLTNLTIIGMIDAFKPNANISGTLRQWLDWGLEDAYLRVIPDSKNYLPDNKFYERGIMAGGRLKLGGLTAMADLQVSETAFGFKAMVDPIEYSSGGFTWFALKGYEQGNKAQVNLQLNSSNPEMVIDGSVTVLGITSKTSIKVNSSGARFKIAGDAAGGKLSASLEVEAQQLTATSGFKIKAEFSNSLQSEVANQLINYIKVQSAGAQQAYTNAQNSLQSARNAAGSDAEKGLIDAANGFLTTFKEIDKGLSVAGQYVVKGLINEAINIKRIYFENSLNVNQFTVVASIDMTIAGQAVTQKATIDLNVSSATAMAEKIVSQIGDAVISFFENLGSTIEKGWDQFIAGANQAVEVVKAGVVDAAKWIQQAGLDFAKSLEKAATEVYKYFDNVINCADVPAPSRGTIPYGIPPSTITRYRITIEYIRIDRAAVPANDFEKTFQTEDKNSLDIFGSIAVVPSGNMWTNKGANIYSYNVKCGNAQTKDVGRTIDIYEPKYFYVKDQDAASAYAFIYIGLDERDKASGNDGFNKTNISIRLADVPPATSYTRTVQVAESGIDAAHAQLVTVSYKVEALEKPSPQQLIAAVNSRNANEVDRLIQNGAEPKTPGLMMQAARNNDYSTMRVLYNRGARAVSADLDGANNPDMILALMNYGAAPRMRELDIMLDNRNINGVGIVIKNGVAPQRSHAAKAIRTGDMNIISKVLEKGVALTREELQLAIATGNVSIISLVMRNGAVPDEPLVIETIRAKNDAATAVLLTRFTPGSAALMEAARQNNINIFRLLLEKGVPLNDNNVVYKAIENNNTEMTALGLKAGGNPTAALNYAIQRNNPGMVQLCLDNRADPSPAVGYAVRNNNMNLVGSLLTTYRASANECMGVAIDAGNNEAAKIALATGRVSPNNFMAAAAEKNNFLLVRMLAEINGDPDLSMPAAVRLNNLEMAGYLLKRGAHADNNSLIQMSVINNSPEMLKMLVRRGADVNAAMPLAIDKNNPAIVHYLLDNGANPNGYMAKPAGAGNTEMVKLLIDKGAVPDEGMSAAVNANQTAVVKMLLMAGARPYGFIQVPAAKNNTEMVADLLRAGANPDPGMRPAVDGNFNPMVKLLLDNGASAAGYLPKPASTGNIEMVTMLLNKNADPNEGIGSALQYNQTAVAKLLIERGANGNRYLAYPAGFGNMELVELLLSKGAEPELGMKASVEKLQTPVAERLIKAGADGSKKEYMEYIVTKNFAPLVPVLVSAGNKVDSTVTDAKGRTYLHNAANRDNNYALVKALLDAHSSVFAKDNDGNTPLHLAVDEGKDDIETVRVLLQAGSDPCAQNNKGKNIFKQAKGSKVKKLIKEFGGSRKCSGD